MKKVHICSINSRYNHRNLAVRYLYSYGKKFAPQVDISYSEWTINQPLLEIIRGLAVKDCGMLLFSVYIWNVEITMKVIAEIKKVRPSVLIGVGGPEVSYKAEATFRDNPCVDFIVKGEGEKTFTDVIQINDVSELKNIPGVYFKDAGGISFFKDRELIGNLDEIPFPYTEDGTVNGKLYSDIDTQHDIVYYESSRGCPFNCAYCLSSLDKTVRYFSLEKVFSEIQFFIDNDFRLIKFVDRTFNLNKERYLSIWKYIIEHNKSTSFHFEIEARLLCDEAFEILKNAKEGTIQFEIGIQSIHPKTLEIVGRSTDIETICQNIKKIPNNIHVHLDLIAGLPEENIDIFKKSFDCTIRLKPEMLQLGFLKILSGTKMNELSKLDSETAFLDVPPYEVLKTKDLPYEDLLKLKDVEHLVDIFYNSGNYRMTFSYLIDHCDSVFDLMTDIARMLSEKGILYEARRPRDYFECFVTYFKDNRIILNLLKCDFILLGKTSVFPSWFNRNYDKSLHEEALRRNTTITSTRESYAFSEFETFDCNVLDGDEVEKMTPCSVLFLYPPIRKGEKSNYTTEIRTKMIICK